MQIPLRLDRGCDALADVVETYTNFDLSSLNYPRESGWPLAWETAQFVGQMLRVLDIKRVVEFGAGWSTLLLGSVLKQCGGHLVSFEHLADYSDQVRQLVRKQGLTESAVILQHSITLRLYGKKILPIYSLRGRDYRIFEDCQYALIDGPPGHVGREAVLYELFPSLPAGAWIVLDDANRPGERRCLGNWKEAFGDALQVRLFPDVGRGLAVVRKSAQSPRHFHFPAKDTLDSWHHAWVLTVRRVRELLPNMS